MVENIDGRPMVLHNDATSSTRWITLELVGARSNRLAIGAKVKAAVGSLVQIDEVRSGGSYLSQSDLRIHFGLDNAEKVERVEIRWPSGQTEVLQNLPANRFYVIKEGEGIALPERARPALKKAAQKNLPRSLAYMSPPEKEIGSSEARAAWRSQREAWMFAAILLRHFPPATSSSRFVRFTGFHLSHPTARTPATSLDSHAVFLT